MQQDIRILIVDDDPLQRSILAYVCDQIKIPFDAAANGEEALQLFETREYPVCIVDLIMPVIGGEELINIAKSKSIKTVFIVQTFINEPDAIIRLMKLGVRDYLLKPKDEKAIANVIKDAIKSQSLLYAEDKQEVTEQQRIHQTLQWLTYKLQHSDQSPELHNKTLVSNIKESFTQGAGFGMVVTLTEMLEHSVIYRDRQAIVDQSIIKLLIRNGKICTHMIDTLEVYQKLFDPSISPGELKIEEVIRDFMDRSRDLLLYAEERNIKILFHHKNDTGIFFTVPDYIVLILRELLLNAVKYSPEHSVVDFYLRRKSNIVSFVFRNDCRNNADSDTNLNHESMLCKPFIRLAATVEHAIPLENFSMGLGLPAAQRLADLSGGQFFYSFLKDHTRDLPVTCFLAELTLPLWENKHSDAA